MENRSMCAKRGAIGYPVSCGVHRERCSKEFGRGYLSSVKTKCAHPSSLESLGCNQCIKKQLRISNKSVVCSASSSTREISNRLKRHGQSRWSLARPQLLSSSYNRISNSARCRRDAETAIFNDDTQEIGIGEQETVSATDHELSDGDPIEEPESPSSLVDVHTEIDGRRKRRQGKYKQKNEDVVSKTLSPESSLSAAITAILRELQYLEQHGNIDKLQGMLRLEVPLPRCHSAMSWLRGQSKHGSKHNEINDSKILYPLIYFSPRRCSAPETDGSIAAKEASYGMLSTASVGAAWMWKGKPRSQIDKDVVMSMHRFLCPLNPRIRVFGGSRFDVASDPAEEWKDFGSFVFVLPRIEFLECSGGLLLCCNIAWDSSHELDPSSNNGIIEMGFASCKQAFEIAKQSLKLLVDPALESLAAPTMEQKLLGHIPDRNEWESRLDNVHKKISNATSFISSSKDFEPKEHDRIEGQPMESSLKLNPDAALDEYIRNGQQGLDDLLAALDGDSIQAYMRTSDPEIISYDINQDSTCSIDEDRTGDNNCQFTKVVLARRSDLLIRGAVDPLVLLKVLQDRDPRAYQIMIQLSSGHSFISSTPECLYSRTGNFISSEAVAGTRARGSGGNLEKDFWLSFDLLRSAKDDAEFSVVREWVKASLGSICEEVTVEVAKSVLKQESVQHLYSKISGLLKDDVDDGSILDALHPTPAVCGQPRSNSFRILNEVENFDRGFYAGPFGWISSNSAEFVVAIRSALLQVKTEEEATELACEDLGTKASLDKKRTSVSLFAGVGIVSGSDTASEWAELNLKIRQYERLLNPVPNLEQAPNIAALWARLIVEELCRQGCNTFCIAPGSRSSPLTVAVAQHPYARIIPCVDERSLGFCAVGYGRASRRPAVVITSSGTAVANLLPSVVEASLSKVPLLLLTADRPAELRDTGANQTINQVNIYGSYVRWHYDMLPPTDSVPARSVLTTIDSAVNHAIGGNVGSGSAGPVHVNCQYREPLAPFERPWDSSCLEGLARWRVGNTPFSKFENFYLESRIQTKQCNGSDFAVPGLDEVSTIIEETGKGLIVVGEIIDPSDSAAILYLAELLQWPIVADVLSGLRLGVLHEAGRENGHYLLNCFDHMLLCDTEFWHEMKPDVVLQIGGHLTSKRIAQFMEWCSLGDPLRPGKGNELQSLNSFKWIYVDRSMDRCDQSHLVTHRVQSPIPAFLDSVRISKMAKADKYISRLNSELQKTYNSTLQSLNKVAMKSIDSALSEFAEELTEPGVSRILSQELPPGEGLFIGNSMPIRDMDMYGSPIIIQNIKKSSQVESDNDKLNGIESQANIPNLGIGSPISANRGASGIDGVLSTAAGFADGLGRGTTLVIGDLSFIHDSNGLTLLKNGESRPPLTVVLINNSGGGIFSFLPIAESLPADIFDPLWSTPQHVDLAGLCRCHGIPHLAVSNPAEFRNALRSSWSLNRHSVIEVVTDRTTNVERHRHIQNITKNALNEFLTSIYDKKTSSLGQGDSSLKEKMHPSGRYDISSFSLCISHVNIREIGVKLRRPLTTATDNDQTKDTRRGFMIELQASVKVSSQNRCIGDLKNGNDIEVTGYGEIAPLPGLHKETLNDCLGQLTLISEAILKGLVIPMSFMSEIGGKEFDSWCQREMGIGLHSLFPSVRFGLETALLNALTSSIDKMKENNKDVNIDIYCSDALKCYCGIRNNGTSAIGLNGLIDPVKLNSKDDEGRRNSQLKHNIQDVIKAAADMVQKNNFGCIKIKVGRLVAPEEDARLLVSLRKALGPQVILRADANQAWSFADAKRFANAVKDANLQYCEEPLQNPEEIEKLFDLTDLSIALDESIDQGFWDAWLWNERETAQESSFLPSCVSAVVLKPSVLGGLSRTLVIARKAISHGVISTISSPFDFPLGICMLVQLAAMTDSISAPQYHGLSTLGWLELESKQPCPILSHRFSTPSKIPVDGNFADAIKDVSYWQWNNLRVDDSMALKPLINTGQYHSHIVTEKEDSEVIEVHFPFLEVASQIKTCALDATPIIFIHGFMGDQNDWKSLMLGLSNSTGRRCISLGLPRYCGTCDVDMSLEDASVALERLLISRSELSNAIIVGYSLGARLALLVASRRPKLLAGVVSISGHTGIEDFVLRCERMKLDEERANLLLKNGLAKFIDNWYKADMWKDFRSHPSFERIVKFRTESLADDLDILARVLRGMSPGCSPAIANTLAELAHTNNLCNICFVAGENDRKFVDHAIEMEKRCKSDLVDAVIVPGAGHAVIFERSLEVLQILQSFITKVFSIQMKQ